MINFNIGYDARGTLESEILRKSILEKLILNFNPAKFTIQHDETFIIQDTGKFDIIDRLSKVGKVYCTKPTVFIIEREDGYVVITTITRSNQKILNCTVYSDNIINTRKILKNIETNFIIIHDKECSIKVRWYYMESADRLDYTVIPETIGEIVIPEAYPYIENLEEFIDSYLTSPEPVLVLVGSGGSGKTKLIRHIVRRIATNIIVSRNKVNIDGLLPSYDDPYDLDEQYRPSFSYTNDSKVMGTDEIFVDFIGDGNVYGLIMEDMDETLKPREEGNSVMSKLLSSSDGFISNYNKKMLLTSNIANINNIDDAFKRPGRCYNIIKTRRLTVEESFNFLKALSPDCDYSKFLLKTDYSLAELYKLVRESKMPEVNTNKVIGF